MTNSNQSESNKIRATMEQIVKRLQTDPGFAEQVKADPTAALTSAGLPQEAVTAFMREAGSSSDVSGFMLQSPDMNVYTTVLCPSAI